MRRAPFSSSASFLARACRPRTDSRTAAFLTAVRKGSDARAAGAPVAANPYREPHFSGAWHEGWAAKDRELAP